MHFDVQSSAQLADLGFSLQPSDNDAQVDHGCVISLRCPSVEREAEHVCERTFEKLAEQQNILRFVEDDRDQAYTSNYQPITRHLVRNKCTKVGRLLSKSWKH